MKGKQLKFTAFQLTLIGCALTALLACCGDALVKTGETLISEFVSMRDECAKINPIDSRVTVIEGKEVDWVTWSALNNRQRNRPGDASLTGTNLFDPFTFQSMLDNSKQN